MFGCDHSFINKITVDQIKFGKCLTDDPQSVRRRDHLVVKKIVIRSEWDKQSQFKNNEKQENMQSYQTSEKQTGEEVVYTNVVVFFFQYC